MKKAAVIPSKGIGDGLMMLIASHNLQLNGFSVTTYSNHLHELAKWFPGQEFAKLPKDPAEELSKYDLVIVQHDFSHERQVLFAKLPQATIFYPSHYEERCPPLTPTDRLFYPTKTMVKNIAHAIASLLHSDEVNEANGITPLDGLIHRKNTKQVIIHPTSSVDERTYRANRFLKIAKQLHRQGYTPVFAVSPSEYDCWESLLGGKFSLPRFHTLSDLAAAVYESGYFIGNESGTSHLASCLKIPTVVISGHRKRISMWRPGWFKGNVVTPPRWVPNLKGLRIRTHYWQWCLKSKKVFAAFTNLVNEIEK